MNNLFAFVTILGLRRILSFWKIELFIISSCRYSHIKLEYTRRVIHNAKLLDIRKRTVYQASVGSVLLNVVVSVFGRVELDNKAVSITILYL